MFKNKILFFIGLLFIPFCAECQASDPGNEGQLKRMVFQQWDDFQPDPTTDWIGIPNNFEGWLFWNVLWNSYYHGPDRRPYRTDGPFVLNGVALADQNSTDSRISDTLAKVRDAAIATDINMQGGSLDIAYDMYFSKCFTRLTTVANNYIDNKLKVESPLAYSRLIVAKPYATYLEQLDILTSRISTIHKSYLDRGKRILVYLVIKKDLETANAVIGNFIQNYIGIMSLPDMKTISNVHPAVPTDDGAIVTQIMSTFKF